MMAATSEHCCSYMIDRYDRLVAVDRGWNQFAVQNHGGALAREQILRTSLWDYITGMENRLIYKRILDCVRKHQTEIRFPLRCDSPTLERHLEMRVERAEDDCCLFVSRLQRGVPRPRVAMFDSFIERTNDNVSICGWCMKIEVPSLGWYSAPEALAFLGLDGEGPLPHLFHTVCPTCYDRLARMLSEHAVA